MIYTVHRAGGKGYLHIKEEGGGFLCGYHPPSMSKPFTHTIPLSWEEAAAHAERWCGSCVGRILEIHRGDKHEH
jgi:hypothetical protein